MRDGAVTGRCEFLLFKDFLPLKLNVYIYIYIFLGAFQIFEQLSTLRGAVTIMINSSTISVHRFIATTLFRVVKEWPHSSGNIHE